MKKRQILEKGALSQLLILGVIILFAVMLAGGLTLNKKDDTKSSQPEESEFTASCCDKGDGDKCQPYDDDDHTFDYNGEKYGLLKSKITLSEPMSHLHDTGQIYKGDPIIENVTNAVVPPGVECQTGGKDQVWGMDRKNITSIVSINDVCVTIPDNELLYVCKDKCETNSRNPYASFIGFMGASLYGNPDTVYDVYFKLADKDNVPDVIKKCNKEFAQKYNTGQIAPKQIIITNTPVPGQPNLQLNNFKVIIEKPAQDSIPWLSPYCKPAIYLYPKEKTDVLVKIAPQGPLTLTIPQYPKDGWKVVAYPSGRIDYQNTTYPYLYYESQIPNTLIDEKNLKGYVEEYSNLNTRLSKLLTDLGLNQNEQSEFLSFWQKALPKSNYYFIGVVSNQLLNSISPLSISPKPDNLIRVTLYFEPLDAPMSVEPPTLLQVSRNGFTAVEWGGLFKKDKTHPFTCFM